MTEKKRPARDKAAREAAEQERTDGLFLVYWQMGPTRSLMGLAELATSVGLKRALSTYKRWSVKYDWQRRVLERNARERTRREQDFTQAIDQMNDRDAAMAQGMKGLLVAAINRYRRQMTEGQQKRQQAAAQGVTVGPELDMDFRDMAALARTAVNIERMARGQATSRTEVWIEVATTIVQEFALIFMTVNQFATEEEREAEFIRMSDDMMTRYYSQATRKGVQLVGNGNGMNNQHG